jgi:4-amino-4-deoxy-L-arabinose transferase-like glycosyltransferase
MELLLLGRDRLLAPLSRFAGCFFSSYRAFCKDLSRLLKGYAADRRGLIWLSLIASVGIVVRIWFLDQPMRYDEAWTFLRFVEPGINRLFDYPAPNNHVAHTLLVYLSTSVFGTEPWAIRLPAFMAGILLMPMTYLCARTVFRRTLGLVAAGLVASCPFLVFYSTNARGYSGVALLTVALLPLSLYFVREESAFAGLLVALLSAIGLFTMPSMLLPIAMLVVWSLLLAYHAGGWPKTLRVLGAVAGVLLLCALATVALYVPVLITSGIRRIVANQYVQPQALVAAMTAWLQTARETWVLYQRDIPGFLTVCLIASALAGALRLWKWNRPAFLLFPSAIVGIGMVLLAGRAIPYSRTWSFLLPLGFCLVDAGVMGALILADRRARVHVAGALGLLFALGIGYHLVATEAVTYYPETGTLPDAEEIVLFLEPRLREGDLVLVRKYWPMRYYGYRLGIPLGVFGKSFPQEVLEDDGARDIYVLVQLPGGTFEKAAKNYPQLDERDFEVREFPSALLYLPREKDG